jgi:MFS family permease
MRVVWRLAISTALIVSAFSITLPVVAVLLQRAGHGTTVVGLLSMLPFLAILVLMPFMPRAVARWGVIRTYRAGCALQLAGAVGFALGDGIGLWALAMLTNGIGAAALWNATETLLAREAPPERRGRVMGLYQTGLGASMALGPFLPALLGVGGRTLLWIAAALVLLCCAAAWTTRLHSVREPEAPDGHGIVSALRAAPWLAVLALAGGLFEAGLSSVSAANAASLGMSLAQAASVAGAIGMGSFLCQYPAGHAADHHAPRTVFTVAALLLLAASLAFAWADRAPWLLWASGAVWGGVGGALYTLTMIRVAHEFGARSTASGAAAMILGYTLGGAIGPPASGAALQAGGTTGLAWLLSVVAAGALLAARRQSAHADD